MPFQHIKKSSFTTGSFHMQPTNLSPRGCSHPTQKTTPANGQWIPDLPTPPHGLILADDSRLPTTRSRELQKVFHQTDLFIPDGRPQRIGLFINCRAVPPGVTGITQRESVSTESRTKKNGYSPSLCAHGLCATIESPPPARVSEIM